MNKTAVKSMLSMLFYLLLLIGIWAVIGIVVFPEKTTENKYADYVKNNAPMLTQVAENAMDSTRWEGIMDVPEIRDLLEKGSIRAVHAYDAGVSFVLPSQMPDGGLYLCYDPSGDAFLDASRHIAVIAQYPGDWTQTESTQTLQRWQGGMMDKGYYNISKLADGFYLVDYYLPT